MRVKDVEEGSFWFDSGVRRGDTITRVNGAIVRDILDVYFESSDGVDSIELVRGGETIELDTSDQGDVSFAAIDFDEFEYRRCSNSCVFCFIDQMPPGLRTTLYFKDEDYRLSFLYGNYLTLTNLSEEDLVRIGEQKLSPLYVSVHTTDDELRRKMLGNPKAPSILGMLKKLAESGIEMHCQIVLCPGINDGEVLLRTVNDLSGLYPSVASVAVVPVGLTSHRDGLMKLNCVDAGVASEVLDLISPVQRRMLDKRKTRFVFLADEFYLLSGRHLPEYEDYEDFAQIEDGVGMMRKFLTETRRNRTERADVRGTFGIVTGKLAEPLLHDFVVPELRNRFPDAGFRLLAAESSLFGSSVTVTGLLSGEDIVNAAATCSDCDSYVIPANCFNSDGVTLDDMSAGDLREVIGADVIVATCNIGDSILERLESQ